MSLRDDCANRDCGHAKETHYLETIPTGRLDQPLVHVRVTCLGMKCDCKHYVPPVYQRR